MIAQLYRRFLMVTKRDAIYIKTFKLLVGDHGETFARWPSFYLKSCLCEEDEKVLLQPFLQSLHYPAPNLQVIEISSMGLSYDDYCCFPEIQALRRFCIDKFEPTFFAVTGIHQPSKNSEQQFGTAA
jgi:hypothetical protein